MKGTQCVFVSGLSAPFIMKIKDYKSVSPEPRTAQAVGSSTQLIRVFSALISTEHNHNPRFVLH